MSFEPLVDAWHNSRQDRTPLRPNPRRRGRWASLEHAVAGGHHRGDQVGITDTTPGRARGPIQTEGPGIDDTDTHDDLDSFDLDDLDLDDLDDTDLDDTEVGDEVDHGHQTEPEAEPEDEPEPEDEGEPEDEPEDDPELGDDEAGDDDEEPAA